MSRAFVKEDSDQPETLPDRPISDLPNYMTATGYQQMQQTLAELEQQLDQLKTSSSFTANAERPMLERDLRYCRQRLQSAQLLSAPAQTDKISFGCQVSFVDADERHFQFRIVGEDEADAEQGTISWASPLARALLGKQQGDAVLWPKPAGAIEIEITEISR
ncbi:transcription elongation factor GreAB [Pokkaliibacter plantistimulans]|uniref:Transcription elongation factor GreAB n=1 Tax=Proteobacteria bacterium 228 TaxID=2083153 RepID=A0A2S5KLM5_9PROT|nr:GreA/GreB family elongation factor [Pokkaliibacter plantistimulans]PPC75734.1 transcription elongation factor GreAB [Pokkaliibacter plantistimulans]